MNENPNNYLTTGEFARLCKVNKQTLIYYDQIGLLSPIHKDAKGYRYYSIRQLEFFNVISLLKELGMTLNDIQRYTLNKSPESFLSLLYEQKAELKEKREQIEMNERIIHAKIKTLEYVCRTDLDQIMVQSCPETTLYLSKDIKDVSSDERVTRISDFYNELQQAQLDTGYPLGSITRREQILSGEFTNYSYLYMEQPNSKEDVPYLRTAQGNFLTGFHNGGAATIHETYIRLLDQMTELKFTLGEYVFEECIYDNVVIKQEENYITKIMIQVF
ncbi:MerR family transcriptional regulator [Paenibacillus paeoniae]|uniref:MerR family transcriptional regulator n=1 Tax=Paenibacillus paeoniae TaxID=2292705 RepID=A0A371PHA1_9BACL|nr:MerR family transcriptional regulator [Paenibacillus paeoniae]REK75581.1 MerR family transcriptional regulator [Paenibacillus paeoniae]